MFENEIEEVKAVIVVFSLIDRASYEHAKFLVEFILKAITNNYMQLILCGNKSDLITGESIINFTEVSEYLMNIPNSNYFEISCKDDINLYLLKTFLLSLEWEEKNKHNYMTA